MDGGRCRHFAHGASLRALGSVGVLDEVVDAGFGFDVWHFCDYAGKKLGAAPQPRIAGPQYPGMIGVLRKEFFEVLTNHARKIRGECKDRGNR